ncbi:MAG TPA: MlaD family protein, partial [Pyrinomonadaceae bacterium]|nr:MlaD family protein [Pyrinomonadaceae bacterium]
MPASKRSVTFSQLRVGIFVLLAIGILVFLVLNASGDINPFSKKLHLKARFSDANGLREGSEVRLAGVRVGKVESIRLLPPSDVPNAPRVEATMTIDSTIDGQPANVRIRSDSTAQQGSPSLLGNEMLINITPGTAVGQPVSEGAILPSSSSNTVNDFATSGTDLAQRLSKLSDEISGIVRDVKDGKGTVGRLFNDEALYNNLNATIRETEDVMRQVRSGNGSAGRFINDPALYENANQIAIQLKTITDDLRAGRGSAGKFLTDDELYNRINRTADRIDRSVEQLNLIVADINAGHGTLGKLIRDEQLY